MVSAACLASLKYGGNVHGSNNAQMRTARAMQAYVQVNSLAGRSITLPLMLAEAPRCDPVYRLNMDPLLAFSVQEVSPRTVGLWLVRVIDVWLWSRVALTEKMPELQDGCLFQPL
eukprot:2781564-Pyramimonas_sp.AAC.1